MVRHHVTKGLRQMTRGPINRVISGETAHTCSLASIVHITAVFVGEGGERGRARERLRERKREATQHKE